MPNISYSNQMTPLKQRDFYDSIDIETAYINLLKKNLKDINKQIFQSDKLNRKSRYSQTVKKSDELIDLTGYLIFITKTKCGNIRLYGNKFS